MARDASYIVKCTQGLFLEERLSLVLNDKLVLNSACSGHRASRKRTKLGPAGEGF